MTAAILARTRGRAVSTAPAADRACRLAWPLKRSHVRASIPSGVPGSYILLGCDGAPLYVGRSDGCLRTRLSRHPLADAATHFCATVTATPRQAWLLESYWWHRYQRDGVRLMNQIHPARRGILQPCQLCHDRNLIRGTYRTPNSTMDLAFNDAALTLETS